MIIQTDAVNLIWKCLEIIVNDKILLEMVERGVNPNFIVIIIGLLEYIILQLLNT